MAKQKTTKTKGKSIQAQIIAGLTDAYWKEIETVQNYIAASTNLDGVDADPIKKALAADIAEELGHAQQLAKRIHVLGGEVPGSFQFRPSQKTLQPTKDSTNVVAAIKGVIDAEEEGIAGYNKIIRLAEGEDYATQDMCIALLADEEEHRREFVGFLKQYTR